MDRLPVARLTEVVRRDRLEYLAAREQGRDYHKGDKLAPVYKYASRALQRGQLHGEHVHYNVSYTHGRNTHGYGMLFPAAGTLGLQSIDGEMKRFLLEGALVFDIDQANAIPTLMIQDARSYGKPLLQLEAYVADRDSWLVQIAHEAMCSQKQAKQLVLSILFGGSHTSWLKDNNWEMSKESDACKLIDTLRREMRGYVHWWDATHGAAVCAIDLRADEELRAKGTNPAFRRIGLCYQDLETKVTLAVKQALESRGVVVRVLCHDGLIASLDFEDGRSDDACSFDGDCSDHGGEGSSNSADAGKASAAELGYDIALELKSLALKSGVRFEQYVQQRWPAETLCDAPVYDPKLKDVQDRLFAEHFIKAKAGQFFKQRTGDDQCIFWTHDGSCWVRGWATLCGWCEELFEGSPYGASAAGMKRLRDYLTLPYPGLIKEPAFDRVPNGMLPCAGGLYYDAVTRETRVIQLDHYVTRLWDLPPPLAETVTEEDLDWVRARVAEVVSHEGLLRSIVPRLAHDLFTVGNPHKSICFFIGDGDNGKTMLMKAIKAAAPPGWVVSTRANNFTGRADGSQQTDWLSKLDGARIVYTEEPRHGEAGSLDCEWLKEVLGDSDVSTRKIYGSEREMQASFSLYFCGNHMPQTAHVHEALFKSFVICVLPGKFVDDPTAFKNNHLSAPWKEYVRPIDRELKDKFCTPQMRSALMLYLCEEYRTHMLSGRATFEPVPAEFAKWKDEVVVEKDLISEAFYSAYELDEHVPEPVRTCDILMHVRGANPELKLNAQALGGFLKREFTYAKHPYVTKKKAHGVMVWVGLKLNRGVGW